MTDYGVMLNLNIKTVPCKWCGDPTAMLGTKMCDGCWELDARIRMQPELARQMLKRYEVEDASE